MSLEVLETIANFENFSSYKMILSHYSEGLMSLKDVFLLTSDANIK